MPELRLARLPDRTPVKATITLPPGLHQALQDYARVYAAAYGEEEPIAELIPAILASFLESDRAFVRARDAMRDSDK
ncbi:DUF2274 domain-containing protein [Sphingosinicella sp. BN140058]|uniref:DUF2274 domain-containing protein n=1 Tax=Sphingosinicella sp. BN140058 TaxID=1892855 RepID=UPI00101246D1|nr:DUF2274 domain-containing protein [Sphingosinicella sp. BN140058]QAY78180.1 DUF2274 domain-containing protein [Sphingosinicella sp. BN140058]